MAVNVNWREDKQQYYGDISGKGIKRKYYPLGPNEKIALKWKKEQTDLFNTGKLKLASPTNCQTFEAYGTTALTQNGGCKSKSMKGYRSIASCHIYPKRWFSQKAIGLIERGDIVTLLQELPDTMSLSQKRMVLAVVSKVLTHAVDAKVIEISPCVRLGKKIPKSPKDRLKALKRKSHLEGNNVLTDVQEQQLLEKLEANTSDPAKFGVFFLTARAGLRISEAIALSIGGCDWEGGDDGEGQIEVSQNISDHDLDSTKSDQIRYVPMTPDVKDVLQFLVGTRTDAEAFVFANRHGGFFNYDQLLQKTWNPVADAMGWGRITPHILRHTYTARLLKAGYDIRDVSRWLGHHSVAFTLEHYGHLQPGEKRKSIAMLDGKKPRLLKLVAGGPKAESGSKLATYLLPNSQSKS